MITRIAIILALLSGIAAPAGAQSFETAARNAIIIDYDTGRILFEKDPEVPIPTASMSKMMTVYMLFERLQSGALSEEDSFTVSERAWRKGGSKMFVEVGSVVSVHDLLRGIVVQSGNDACIVVAEGLAGSEDAFAEQATARARELGLTQTVLKNSTGWPEEGHQMSVHDLARLAILTIRNFPEYYPLYAETSFTFNGIKQSNRNPLLYRGIGADGLKTGHTEEAGYGLVASAVQGDQRLIMVLSGMAGSRERADESERVMRWAQRTFATYRLADAGLEIEQADVWLGERPRVPLVAGDDVVVAMARTDRARMKAEVVYDGPVPAPVKKGDRLATLVLTVDDARVGEFPLVAGADVEPLGPLGRIGAVVGQWIWGTGS
ncbi:MAG: D-alanyl-D-alanine carboxypeptidase family protein [Pseudomonadota bacterium]|nr:D-alanyl-D-alanine carboxypeptidase family protein [Pseudomonadota bacterium]